MKILNWARGGGGGPGLECEYEKKLGVSHYLFEQKLDLMEEYTSVTCGWKKGDVVRTSIQYPNGKLVTQTSVVGGNFATGLGSVVSSMRPMLDDPAGEYRLTFQGSTGTLVDTVTYRSPRGAHVYWLGDNRLLLYGFAPHEKVTLVAYDPEGSFLNWQDVQVKQDGGVVVSTSYPDDSLVRASGAQTLQDLEILLHKGSIETAVEMCTRTRGAQFSYGRAGEAIALGGITMYAWPDSRSKVVGRLQNQERLTIQGDARCAEGMRWWQVKTRNGLVGYAPEADTKSYYLQAVPGGEWKTLFLEEFKGPDLNREFTYGRLPSQAKYRYQEKAPAQWLGASSYTFQTLDGFNVIRMQNRLANQQRRGWLNHDVSYPAGTFWAQARFNTMVQSSQTGIDQLIELWLTDGYSDTLYDFAAVTSAGYGANRFFTAESSISGSGGEQPFQFADNTWYRLVIKGSTTQNLRAVVYDDSVKQELASIDLGHTLMDYPLVGFRVGLSQSVGKPGGAYPTDAAVDWLWVVSER